MIQRYDSSPSPIGSGSDWITVHLSEAAFRKPCQVEVLHDVPGVYKKSVKTAYKSYNRLYSRHWCSWNRGASYSRQVDIGCIVDIGAHGVDEQATQDKSTLGV